MTLNIYLVDINSSMCKAWEKYKLPDQVKIINSSVTDLILNGTNIYVSPANSLGLMRGGIDGIYRKMFPNIENDVRDEIRKLGHKNGTGHFYLPVCSALLVNISGDCTIDKLKNCKNYVICCPSMLLPGSNIEGTENVYYCYKSIMTLIKKLPFKVDNVIIPGIGTGIGGIAYEKCANEFYKALKDFGNNDETPNNQYLVLNTKQMDKQPNISKF
jgi:O-acetyl-ADP-ribose deacetylase (regulator of RNase III)